MGRQGCVAGEIPTVRTLEELAALIDGPGERFVRWSEGPDVDREERSRDELTGVELPGLSVSALSIEPWWGRRDRRLWVARRLYDYRHLEYRRCAARPWVLTGRECGRGPDNEPLVRAVNPVAWIAPDVVEEATALMEGFSTSWGPLDRNEASP
ncbi:MAG: hypothetical protein JWM85_182 [Acidimicrobiaceae bacterium]|nr:hypothetical protein [Acidimicrobiaceae bacterium]